MRIYICDDEKPILEQLAKEVKRHVQGGTVLCFSSGYSLLEMLKTSACDVLFLDIDLPDISGMDIAGALSRMHEPPLLVFVTSHDELVYESLQYHPFGFIRKSYIEQEIGKVLQDCTAQMETAKRRFSFRAAGRDVVLPLADILYFEADGNYLKVCAKTAGYRFRLW